ncbi:MAG: hypothetical protein LBG44_11915 [Gemmatimonadota bacterium]|nr:hypothetical protein [Gemmatimonadota bacterium]
METKDDLRRRADPLGVMYVLAAAALLFGSLVSVLLVFLPRGESMASDDVYTPGSIEGFRPLVDAVLDVEPTGVTRMGENRFRVVMEAFNWGFLPEEIRVPAGAEVVFRARSVQDFHGLAIAGTDIILSLRGNEIAEAVHTFTEPGEYTFICADYCGAGHASMIGKIIVE